MTKNMRQIVREIVQAFRSNEKGTAWNLVVQHIGGKLGNGVGASELTADCVPIDLTWKAPSLVQAFALTFDGDGWQQAGRRNAFSILSAIEADSSMSMLNALTLTELRAALYGLQRNWHDSDSSPEPKFVERIVGEIRQRFLRRDAVWREDALSASVEAYLLMMANEEASRPYDRQEIYRELALRFDRSAKEFKRRLEEISYVLAAAGEGWILDLKGSSRVDKDEAAVISHLIDEQKAKLGYPVGAITKARIRAFREMTAAETPPGTPWPFYDDFALSVDGVEPRPGLPEQGPPPGILQPREVTSTVVTWVRDEAVRAWVLLRAKGRCECCTREAPFLSENGVPFLEVHHLRRLANLGSDRHSNAVAVCPNCHRHLHHGQGADALVLSMYQRVGALVPE